MARAYISLKSANDSILSNDWSLIFNLLNRSERSVILLLTITSYGENRRSKVMIQSKQDLMQNINTYLNMENSLKSVADRLDRHTKIHKDWWGFTLWNNEDMIQRKDMFSQNEKLLLEVQEDYINGTNTTILPEKFVVRNNVITTIGMSESIDRDIGAVATDLDWNSIGTSSTAEAESQTDLQSEFTDTAYARKVFSTDGSRARVNQTMKLGMLWDSTSFDSVPVTIKESGVHWHLSDASKCHARVVSTDFALDTGDLFVVQINELQENGTL